MSNTEIATWLVDSCGISQRKAAEIADRFNDELWISEVESLKNCLECSPHFLEKFNFPLAIQLAIKSQVFVRLEDLSANDVKAVLQLSFKEEPLYGLRYHAAKINGTVLNTVTHHQTLFEWGIDSLIHAEAFFRRIEQWKEEGVASSVLQPKKYIRSDSGKASSSSTAVVPMETDDVEINEKEDRVVAKPDIHPIPEKKASIADSERSHEREKHPCDDANNGDDEKEDGEVLEPVYEIPKPCRTIIPDMSMHHDDVTSDLSVDSAAVPKKKAKIEKTEVFTDPGERMSPRTKVPCQIFDPAPVKRAEKQPMPTLVRELEKDHKPVGRPQKFTRRVSVPPDVAVPGSSGAIVELVAHINSGRTSLQVKALNSLHKMIVDDPKIVAAMRTGGAVDKLLDLLSAADELDVSVLIAVLDVVNTIIALSRDNNVEYIMDQGVLGMVLPLCQSRTARVRLLAVWVIGNAGTVFFKDLVIRPAVITALLESYNTIGTFKPREIAEMRDRFGETMKQLCSGSVSAQFYTLTKLMPIMVDIISKEDRVEPVTSACEALNHLIDSNGSNAVDAFIGMDVTLALIARLSASRAMIVFSSLRALAFIAACSNETQMKALDPVASHLQVLVLGSEADAPSQKVFAQAGLLVSMLCKHGERPIQLIMENSPGVFQQFFDVLNLRNAMQVKQGKVNPRAQNAALALMYAAQRGSNAQLAYLLGQGLYTLCFRILATFDDIPNLLVQTLKALRRLVVKVENIAEVQRGEDEFDADKAWNRVRALMHTNKAGHLRPQDIVADSDSGMENDSQSTTDAKVRKYAVRLHEAATVQKLLSA